MKPIRPGRGFTLAGAAELSASLAIEGVEPDVAQIAARLWDVAPDGESQLLVGRGTFRIELSDLRVRLPVRPRRR